jgi:hypothetical protein
VSPWRRTPVLLLENQLLHSPSGHAGVSRCDHVLSVAA